MAQLGMARVDVAAAEVAANWVAGEDMPGRCPILSAAVAPTDFNELDARARSIAASVAPAPAASKPVMPAASTPARKP